MTTFLQTTSFTVVHCWRCGVPFGVTAGYETRRRNDHEAFFCPAGHQNYWQDESRAEQLARELAVEKRRYQEMEASRNQARAETDRIELRRRAAVGQVTKIKKRVANGVCPCCQRHFVSMERHMATKHPDYARPSQQETDHE